MEWLRKARFRRHAAHGDFARAVASQPDGWLPRDDEGLHACLQLGLHATVAGCPNPPQGGAGGFAVAVSLAACGRTDEAAAQARAWLAAAPAATPALLADALAPHAPALALALIEDHDAPVGLRAGLLLRAGRDEAAARCLRQALQAAPQPSPCEWPLLLGNAAPASPAQQLAHLNDFLAAHQLTPVALRDASLPPGPLNLRPAGPLPALRGPRVTVLMTAWRAASRIGPAIESLLAQTWRDLELIVVDDASDDDTAAVVRALAASDPRIRSLRLPCNVGTYVAKHIGLRHATGEFVTCQDADDWSHPQRIERQLLPLLRQPQLVFTSSQWLRMQDDGLLHARRVSPLLRPNPASPLFRRQPVQGRAGSWDPVRSGADSEFLARLKLVFGRRAQQRVLQPLCIGAHRPGSLTTADDQGDADGASPMAPVRLAYWEAFTHWHIAELRRGRAPRLPADPGAPRVFEVPAAIEVPRSDIERCLRSCAPAPGG